MCRKLMFLISLLFVLGMVSVASATEYDWTNDYPWSQLYISPWNWDPVAPYGGPGPGDRARFGDSELPLIIDGDVEVERFEGPDNGDMNVYLIQDANIIMTHSWRIRDAGDGHPTVWMANNARVVSDGDDWEWQEDCIATLNMSDNTYLSIDGDFRVAGEEDDIVYVNMSGSAVMEIDGQFRNTDDGGIHLTMTDDAILDAKELRARTKDQDSTISVSGNAQLILNDGYMRMAGGEGEMHVTISDNALVEVDDYFSLGEDNDHEAPASLTMLGGLLDIGGSLRLPQDGDSQGHITVNLFGGVISADEREHDTDDWAMDVEAGLMVLEGDVVWEAEQDRDAGRITAYHTRGDLMIDYNAPGYADKTRIYAIPNMRRAWNPSPAHGATGVPSRGTVLGWSPGDFAEIHHLFFSDDEALVTSRSLAVYVGGLATTSYALPDLQLATTYYWVIDEQDEAVIITDGLVWQFTTEESRSIEDFEQYTTNPHYIFDTWIDGCGDANGVGGNGTGSCVDLDLSAAHQGSQSMLYAYDNTGNERDEVYSEATLTYADIPLPPQNYTNSGEMALVVWVRGNSGNAPSSMWIMLNENTGAIATYGDNGMGDEPNDILTDEWIEWNIDLADFAAGGVDLTNVVSISIGFGDRSGVEVGGVGTVNIDDMAMYPVRCVPKYTPDIFDLNADCVVDWYDIEIVGDNWLDDLR